MDFAAKFEEGRTYEKFLEDFASPGERQNWQTVYDQVQLSEPQLQLLQSFRRQMKVLVTAGAWCGDCVQQCPIFAHFAAANERIQLRFFDRDDSSELSQALSTCGAPRVPAVLFLSEDNHVCGRYGDRTLATYRRMAAGLGLTVPKSDDRPLLVQVTQHWLDEFERIQWMLRTSGRLRQIHGD